MAETINGIAIESIANALVTENGSHMLLNVKRADGEELSLAFPAASLQALLTLAAKCATRIDEKQDALAGSESSGTRRAIAVEDWSIHQGEDKRLFQVLKIAGGAELRFSLPAQTSQQIFSVQQLLERRSAEGNER